MAIPQNYLSKGGWTTILIGDNGLMAYFAHGEREGRVSGRVKAGERIGVLGASGNATRDDGTEVPHLHFAVGQQLYDDGSSDVDPAVFFREYIPT
jgi:murein DD-endopeptidase MepM/ murein hydrolase activator NlpD